MNINTWSVVAVPLCILAAIVALTSSSVASAATMQWALLAILLCATIASYLFSGWLPALVFAILLILAVVVQFLRPRWIP